MVKNIRVLILLVCLLLLPACRAQTPPVLATPGISAQETPPTELADTPTLAATTAPSPARTATATRTRTPTATRTRPPPTATSIPTNTNTATPLPPTNTPVPTATFTLTPTEVPTDTPTLPPPPPPPSLTTETEGADRPTNVIVSVSYSSHYFLRFGVFVQVTGEESDGAGISHVDFEVNRQSDGLPVYSRTESVPAYCIFGGGEPDCNSWTLDDNVYKWSPRGEPLTPDVYSIFIRAWLETPVEDEFGELWEYINWFGLVSIDL
jgi:hypothetical protein